MASLANSTTAPFQDRRMFLKSAMTTAAMVAVVTHLPAAYPVHFDPVAYIADMRAIGVTVMTAGGYLGLYSKDGGGFGDDYMAVCYRWAYARKACPDPNGLTIEALLNETR